MTVLELVDRERKRLRRMHIIAGLALAVGATCLVLALGVSFLGSARWMALPRPVPFLVWLVVLAADVGIVVWTGHDGSRLEDRIPGRRDASSGARLAATSLPPSSANNRCAPARCAVCSRFPNQGRWAVAPPTWLVNGSNRRARVSRRENIE